MGKGGGCLPGILLILAVISFMGLRDVLIQRRAAQAPVVDPSAGSINMLQPQGFPEQDRDNAVVNNMNANANFVNAMAAVQHAIANLYNSRARTEQLAAQGQYEVDHANACETHPYQQGCLPPGMGQTQSPMPPIAWLIVGLVALLVGGGVYGATHHG